MTLSFTPDAFVYDDEKGRLLFFAKDGPRLVRCSVTKNALVSLVADPMAGLPMERIYRRCRQRVQQVAAKKYADKQFEPNGTVVVRRRDLAV